MFASGSPGATRHHPLIIDPVLGYSSILSGSSDDQGFGIAVDSAGSVYVTGTTISSDFPVSLVPVQATRAGESDAFVTKLDATGLIIVYSTFLGGSGADAGQAIAVDGNGSAYIAGTTNSNNFPTTLGSFQTGTRGGDEAFVARLGPDGSALVFSTYLGSNGSDSAFGIALDGVGNAYVTGFTTAPSFPNNNAIPCFGTKSTGSDVFVVRVNPDGLTLGFCTFIGGAGQDVGNAIAVDPSGNIWVVGTTTSVDLPLPLGIGLQSFLAGAQDAFVAKLNPTGVVVALTYLGGVGDEEGLAVAVDPSGNVYAAGSTKSADFPTFRALQPFLNGRTNAFVVKLSPGADSVGFATFLGGSGDDSANAVAVNPTDSTVYLAGSTNSFDFPVVAPIQGQLAGGFDVFVAKLTAAGDALVYSTYLGGTSDEEARALAVDVNGVAYVAGSTRSVAFPAVRLVGTGGLLDVFVTQITDVPIIQFTSATYQVNETAGNVTISVQRIGDTTGTATVQFATSNGTATAGSDFGTVGVATPPSGTLGFGPGQIVATFTIPIINNGSACEGDETVNLSLSNPSFGTVLGSRNASTLTILETSSCINFTSPTYTVAENKGPAQISVSRSGPTGIPATVQFSTSNLTAVAGVDYTAVVNRTVTFGLGVKTVNVPIPITNNSILDGTRTVNLSLSGAVGAELVPARSTAVLSILDDETGGTIQFASALTKVAEAVGVAQVLVSRTGSTAGGAMVDFTTVNGTAIAGTDFGALGDGTPPSGTLTFAAGQTSQKVFVPIIDTAAADGVRSLTLTLSNPLPASATLLGARTTTTLQIIDNEASFAFSAATYSTKENAGSATITVELTGVTTGLVTVDWATSDVTAIAGTDYGTPGNATPPSGTLTFPAGGTATGVRTKTFAVRILQDQTIEDTKTVHLTLSNPTGGTAIVPGRAAADLSIADDDIGGTIQFSAATYTVGEGAGSAAIVLTRTGGTGGGATVDFATSDGTGVAGTDYTTTTGTAVFAAAKTSLTFLVPILDNATPDGVRTVNLTLSNPGPNGTTHLGTRITAILKIVDNDVSLAFSAPTYSVKESVATATITVELAGVNAAPVTVTWATSDGTALAGSDYGTAGNLTPPTGTLTFPAGGTPTTVRTKTFPVRIIQDRVLEATETVNLTLSAPSPGAQLIAGRNTAVLSIVDDDIGGVMQFSAATYTVGEAAGTASIVITRTGSTAGGATVDFATSDGTAVAGTDYTTTAGTAVFGVGQTSLTFTVPVADTPAADGVRTVNLALTNPGPNATTTLGARSAAVLKIVDNNLSLAFSAPNYSVRENVPTATITVELTGVNAGPVTVAWATSNGSATAGADYGTRGSATPPSGVLNFPAGGTLTTVRTKTFAVPILSDTIVEGIETVNLTLSGPTGGAGLVVGRDTATLSIGEDDVAGVIQFSALTYNAVECATIPCNATLTVSRTGGLASGVTVDFTTADGTAVAGTDYTATTGTLTFGASQTSQTIKIPLLIEPGAQPTKSFSVLLSNPGSGATLGARTSATVNVTDTR